MEYTEIYRNLTYKMATLIFLKKDGTVRVMLGTRNMDTISLEYGFQGGRLGAFDNRCNIKNNNIAVFDMIVGDARSFNVDRLISITYHGVVDTKEDLERVVKEHIKFKEDYESSKPKELDMEMLD